MLIYNGYIPALLYALAICSLILHKQRKQFLLDVRTLSSLTTSK